MRLKLGIVAKRKRPSYGGKKRMTDHDYGYKRLFSQPEMIRDPLFASC